ncbi:actin-like ATPase domain-containing protein [Nadsonia fulvescens var. elongata DSM 6958]|uniref:Actin-like ATPase domain-containing protein n=1 Tax=Nadsonia fulvescens var. elongata DSM 6958 TaxID=857566 RepID=A0A1E3PM01_9ASCO|nr:actin-like ATPase domain-containing protein [Nadsonia fulvescens var. elongata DSM 6958]
MTSTPYSQLRSRGDTPVLPPPLVYKIRDAQPTLEPEPVTHGWKAGLPIAIDLGSYQTRIGYTSSDLPSHIFPTLSSKLRDRKISKTYHLVGNDIYLDNAARQTARSPFDGNILANWDLVENILDYSFSKIDVQSIDRVDNPIVINEAVGSLFSQRKNLQELLYECYNVPSASVGIDSMFSFYKNGGRNGLVISSGHEASYVIPVYNGKGIFSKSKRIDWGGHQSSQFMMDLLGMKYPTFPSKLNQAQSTFLVQDHCYMSTDYKEELNHFLDFDGLETRERVVEAPYTEVVANQKSEEELAKIAERRKESGKRLQEQAAKMRSEKLAQKESELIYYKELKERVAELLTKRDQQHLLETEGFDDERALLRTINDLEKSIKRSRKDDDGDENESVEVEVPTFPLLDIDDSELDAEQIKAKRHQKLLKANWEARQRFNEEKKLEKLKKQEEERKEKEWREDNLSSWIEDKRGKLNNLLQKKRDRQKLKEELSNRKSLASQMRMKSIASLAAETKGSKRRRANGGGSGSGGSAGSSANGATGDVDPDDTFGADDGDWSIYRDIVNVIDSEAEEEERQEIEMLENSLLEFDPDFSIEDTLEAEMDWRKSTIHMFLRGPREFDPLSQAHSYRMHLNVERIRVPEVLFQPTIAGIDQAGITEVSRMILLERLNADTRSSISKKIFLTGGQTLFPQFDQRVRSEFTSILPTGAEFNVTRANDPLLDAWKGMAKWANAEESKDSFLTKSEWHEMGPDYIKEHQFTVQ